jgi:hypothetical protein
LFFICTVPDQQLAVAQRAPPLPNLRRSHVARRQKIAPQTIGYLVGIEAVVLFLGRSDGTQHQRMCHLHRGGVRYSPAPDFRNSLDVIAVLTFVVFRANE